MPNTQHIDGYYCRVALYLVKYLCIVLLCVRCTALCTVFSVLMSWYMNIMSKHPCNRWEIMILCFPTISMKFLLIERVTRLLIQKMNIPKKTIDNPNSWWKGWGAYIVVKFPFLFKNQVFNCGNQSRIWGEKFFIYNFDGKW